MVPAVTVTRVAQPFSTGYSSAMAAWSSSINAGERFSGVRNTPRGSRFPYHCRRYDQEGLAQCIILDSSSISPRDARNTYTPNSPKRNTASKSVMPPRRGMMNEYPVAIASTPRAIGPEA